tara:strand:+ start:5527 stop:5892 length:366 start_codon:yes stop_codon:yes gene_type:complete
MRQWKLGEICQHGSLGRQCELCSRDDDNAELAEMIVDLREQLAAAEREIEKLRGAMNADDERLSTAAGRVGCGDYGCDAADHMADKIEGLRTQLAAATLRAERAEAELAALRYEVLEGGPP